VADRAAGAAGEACIDSADTGGNPKVKKAYRYWIKKKVKKKNKKVNCFWKLENLNCKSTN
jgi:hypothetical protein